MEPFSLNLQQVTFECGDLSEDQTSNSFNNAVHYDYDSEVVESSTQTGQPFWKNLIPVCKPDEQQCTCTSESRRLSGSVDCQAAVTNSVWSDLKPSSSPSQQNYSTNSHGSCNAQVPRSSVKASTSSSISSEIKILQQISTNTSAIRDQCKLNMSFTSEKEKSTADTSKLAENHDSSAFENVAEALHLQWSVIGNKTVTPASPEVVAQIVAEAQKQKLLGNTSAHAHNVSLADLVPSKDGTLPNQGQSLEFNSSLSSEIHLPVLKDDEVPIQTSQNTDPVCTRLITVPAENIVREKSSWFGKSTKPNMPVSSPEDAHKKLDSDIQVKSLSENKVEIGLSESINQERPEDLHSVSSYSSEKELSMLNSDNDTESFLQSLPKYKPVDMSQFTIKPKFTRDYSPPVRDTSFVPHSTPKLNKFQTNDMMRPDSENSSLIDSEYSIPVQTLDFPSFIIPQAGPLFSNKQFNIPTKRQISDVSVSSSSDIQVSNLLLEKTKLEGQLEMLSQEVQGTLQERAELHAQVASLKLKLMSSKSSESDPEKESLRNNVNILQEARISCEKSLAEAQKEMEEKTEEIKVLQEDLQMSQDVNSKLQMRVKELLDEYRSKEITIQALKNKVAELYVDVQMAIQAKMESDTEARNVKNEHSSLLNAKQWYQQQLQAAQEARSHIQKELSLIQAQFSSQGSIVERLKTDNIKLRLQLTEIQQCALKEKELLARHLEAIQADMMEREAAFQEIQRERSLIEDTFNYKIQSVNDEQSRISVLLQGMNSLENQLDKAHNDLKKKQSQIFSLENEHMETMKQLTISQESILDKDRIIEELEQKLIEVEAKLKAFQNDIEIKDRDILKLREEKATTEISLNAVMEEKLSVDRALDVMKGDLAKVEKSFKQMKQELNARDVELENVKQERNQRKQLQETAEKQLASQIKNRDSLSSESDGKTTLISELQVQKQIMQEEVKSLRQNLQSLQTNYSALESNKEKSDSEIQTLSTKLMAAEQELKIMTQEHEIKKEEVDTLLKSSPQKGMEDSTQKNNHPNESDIKIVEENQKLKESINKMEKDSKKDLTKQKAKTAKANADLKLLQQELTKRQSIFDSEITQLTSKLHEIIAEKDRLEAEVEVSNKKRHLASIETQEQIQSEIQSMAVELEQNRLQKKHLETQLLQLQDTKNNEILQYQQQLALLESQLEETLEIHSQCTLSEETRQKLELELEKERGRVMGLMQSNSGLKQHIAQLEEALASRESSLVEIQSQMQDELKERERLGQECNRRIQRLEGSLQKEKNSQRELRKQIGSKITENKKLQRQSDSIKLEHEQVKHELTNKLQDIELLQSEISRLSELDNNQQATIFTIQNDNKGLVREVEKLKRDSEENSSRNPLIAEQMQNLQWQLSQKCQEVEVLNEKLETYEERQALEVEGLKNIIQKNQSELELLRGQLSSAKQEKMSQQTRVSELRSTLKASVQHHKLTKKMRHMRKEKKSNEVVDVGTQVETDDYDIPPLPFDLDVVEKLIQDTTVSALQSKPLNNLQSCLSALRSEITGLQTEMDSHKITVETSSQSWKTVENHVEELQEAVKVVTTAISSFSSPPNISIADNFKKDSKIIEL